VTFPWLIATRKTLSAKLCRKSVPVQLDTRAVSCTFLAYIKSYDIFLTSNDDVDAKYIGVIS
jgi:hypothetical protein